MRLTSGELIAADAVVLAVPPWRLGSMLPDDAAGQQLRGQISRLETAPISSVHLWYDRPLTDLPHAVIVGRLSQWLFAKPGPLTGENRSCYQVVISASRMLKGQAASQVIAVVARELSELFPESQAAQLTHARLVTEQRSVFSPLPGVDSIRPTQQSPWTNIQLAGDWTQTGWPSTMESAVRSGYLAAENILRSAGQEVTMLQPDLKLAAWARLLGIRSNS